MTEKYEPHDPTDPHQIMCEHFRRGVLNLVLNAETITVNRELPAQRQVSAQINGILTALVQIVEASHNIDDTKVSLHLLMEVLPQIHEFATTGWEAHQALRLVKARI